MTPRVWKCQRVTNGKRCGHINLRRIHVCAACGKRRPPTKKPDHMRALDTPYEQWVELFGSSCGICGAEQKPGGRRLHRDHDHRTGKPRGTLCFPCNSALRPYMTVEWLERALAYLRRSQP